VNALSPGPTGTDLFLKGKSDELIKTFANASPSGKVSEPEQIADVVGFLASENC
jgi:3-oxoacyl-[acyl-carrier protein] reductase